MSTTNHEWARVRELLERAMELDGEPRERFLDQSCAGDRALRSELEQLLARDADRGVLESPLIELFARPLDGGVKKSDGA